jgi:integrase
MGFGEKIGKGRYRARYLKLDGGYGTLPDKYGTKRLAAQAANDEEKRVREAGLAHVDPRQGLVPFGEWAAEWMDGQSKRPATMSRRRYLLRTYLLPEWEHNPIGGFSWPLVTKWAKTTDPVSEVSVRQAISLLSSILTGAVDEKKLTVNPIFRRAWEGHDEPAESVGRVWAHPAEVLRISDRMETEAEKLMVLTAEFTGMRYGEMCALHRDNCLTEKVLRVNHKDHAFRVLRVDPRVGAWHEDTVETEDGGEKVLTYIGPPKNPASARDVYLPEFLIERIEAHLATWPHEFVFSTPSGTKWLRTNWKRTLAPAADGRLGALERELSPTQWQRIAADILKQVSTGRLRTGDVLPTLVEQARTYSAGRATVQKAVDWLAGQGVVDTSGRRTRVAAGHPNPPSPTTVIPGIESWEPIAPGWRLHGGRHWCKSAMEDGDELGALPTVFQRKQLGHKFKGIDGRYTHVMLRSIQRFTVLMQRHWEEGISPTGRTDQDRLLNFSHRVEIEGEKRRHSARPRRSEAIGAHSSVG